MNPKLSLAVGIICISFSPIFVKLLGVWPVTAAFYRIFLGWLFLAPYCLIKGNFRISFKDLLLVLTAGIVFASDIAVWNISIMKMSATISTLLANLTPVWVGLMSYFILKKRSGWLFWTGTCIAIGGMVVLVGLQNIIGLKFNIEIMFAISASLLYSIYIMITKNVLQRVDTLTFMFYNMLGSSLFLFVILLSEHASLRGFSGADWLYFLAMGLICQLTGWLTLNYAIKRLEPVKVSITLLSQTVIAGFLAAWLLKEELELKEIIGSLIVLSGIALTFFKPEKTKENCKLA